MTILILLSASAMSAELFRYRGAARDGGTLEYIFESEEQDAPQTATKERVAEIAADFMTTFLALRLAHWRPRNSATSRCRSGWYHFLIRSRDRCTSCTLSSFCPTGTWSSQKLR